MQLLLQMIKKIHHVDLLERLSYHRNEHAGVGLYLRLNTRFTADCAYVRKSRQDKKGQMNKRLHFFIVQVKYILGSMKNVYCSTDFVVNAVCKCVLLSQASYLAEAKVDSFV